jgi:hypothetical protein
VFIFLDFPSSKRLHEIEKKINVAWLQQIVDFVSDNAKNCRCLRLIAMSRASDAITFDREEALNRSYLVSAEDLSKA